MKNGTSFLPHVVRSSRVDLFDEFVTRLADGFGARERRGCATRARTRAGFTRARSLASSAWHRASPPRAMSRAPPEPPGEGAETSGDDVDDVSRLLALDATPTSELAAVAASRGFRDASTRARAWPKLLALDVTRADAAAALFEGHGSTSSAGSPRDGTPGSPGGGIKRAGRRRKTAGAARSSVRAGSTETLFIDPAS